MDDKNLSNLINSLSPDDIQSLQSVAQSLFGGQNQGGQQAEPTQQNTPLPTAGQNGAAEALGALSGIDPAMMKKLSAIMGAMNCGGNDSRTAFIAALKPLLSPERRHKADEALRMMRLLEMLPILRDQGVL